jgi:hypothetical protein
MTFAHFIIAGAQRSGTTLLYHLLDQHPEIEMARPLRPEPRFFLRTGAERRTLDEYRQELFSGKPGARTFGEKSTSYMERSDAAKAMCAVLPDVRLIFILRDPVERAISNYRFSTEHGAETLSITEALCLEDQRRNAYDHARFSVSPFAYTARGHYCELLEPWERALGRDRIHLLLFEDLVRDANAIQPLLRWLGVAERNCVLPESRVNASGDPIDIPDSLRRELVAQFADSNRRLAQRYGLDLSSWQS